MNKATCGMYEFNYRYGNIKGKERNDIQTEDCIEMEQELEWEKYQVLIIKKRIKM